MLLFFLTSVEAPRAVTGSWPRLCLGCPPCLPSPAAQVSPRFLWKPHFLQGTPTTPSVLMEGPSSEGYVTAPKYIPFAVMPNLLYIERELFEILSSSMFTSPVNSNPPFPDPVVCNVKAEIPQKHKASVSF